MPEPYCVAVTSLDRSPGSASVLHSREEAFDAAANESQI
jgi:hypothetical protein